MSELAKSAALMDARQFSVKWKTETIGWVDSVDLSGIKMKSIAQTIGELNGITVDTVLRGGLEGTIKTVLHEVDTTRIRKLCPWAAATGSFSIAPTTDIFSRYANAGLLTLHPRGASGTTNDINILKAFPNISWPSSAGDKFRSMMFEWEFFPDRTALETDGTIVYGYMGDPPA